MKIESPPKIEELDFSKYIDLIGDSNVQSYLHEIDKRYLYWAELKHRDFSPFKSAKEAWSVVKTNRFIGAKSIYIDNYKFTYNINSFIQEDLHLFDLKLMGGLYKNSITPEDQQEYFKNSLVEEAIASSQIEGAATITNVARDMIKSGRKPKTESEQMIINNFRAIKEIENRLDEELTNQLILDIHEIMTVNTEASKYSGSFRDHAIYVKDHVDGEIAFTAPDHEKVDRLIFHIQHFINNEDEFVHPIIKASILHFMIGFIHPFGDGNGRTARALFYWYLMKKGYLLLRHISFSKAILNSRISYDKAFLKTEHDDNDLNYFIMYSIKSLRVAFQNLVKYRDRKRDERQKANMLMYDLVKAGFNKRQADLLGYLFLKPNSKISTPIYSKKHDVVRQTASRDLLDLENKGILNKYKDGKTIFFNLTDKEIIKSYLKS